MMVVFAIIAILAMITILPSLGRIVKEQVYVALPLADIVKEPIAATWKLAKTLPVDNKKTGLPDADKIVSNLISSVEAKNAAIHMLSAIKPIQNQRKSVVFETCCN